MKLDQLKGIIREEVQSAVRQELKEIIVEAVEIASRPSDKPVEKVQEQVTSTPQQNIDRKQLAELIGLKEPPKQINIKFSENNKLDEMLQQTRQEMSGGDYKNIISATSDMVAKPNFANTMASQMGMTGAQPGLDISSLDFVSKAKKVYDKAVEKSKNKL